VGGFVEAFRGPIHRLGEVHAGLRRPVWEVAGKRRASVVMAWWCTLQLSAPGRTMPPSPREGDEEMDGEDNLVFSFLGDALGLLGELLSFSE